MPVFSVKGAAQAAACASWVVPPQLVNTMSCAEAATAMPVARTAAVTTVFSIVFPPFLSVEHRLHQRLGACATALLLAVATSNFCSYTNDTYFHRTVNAPGPVAA